MWKVAAAWACLWLPLVLCDTILLVKDNSNDCRSCNVENCFPVGDCVAGTVKDKCGCCDICGKSEFELCDYPGSLYYQRGYYGTCGEQLECKLRGDQEDGEEAVCYCKDQEPVCGSDGRSYDNVCQLNANAAITGSKIEVAKEGPCHAMPVIVNHPQNVKNTTGSSIAILCEARGYPIPVIEWTWTRVDGKVFNLPSDDLHISINMRGGPEKWQVTGWLQIMDLKKIHEGDYTCIAENENGFAKSSARVKVSQKKSKEYL